MDTNRTKMDEERKTLQEWATQNNIDMKYLMDFGMRGGPPLNAPTPTITQ